MSYRVSKSLNGDSIKWIARTPKSRRVVARADSEEELWALLEARDNPVKVETTKKGESNGPKSTKKGNSLRRRKTKK